jgi:inhibitor of KinA sporulation pathway (predicted exonuclease)
MIRFAIDLEMNCDGVNPPDEIIQIGVVFFDTETKEVIEKFNRYIKISTPLHDYITKLTGITQKCIDEEGVSLYKAYTDLVEIVKKYNTFRQAIQWGASDIEILKQQLFEVDDEDFAFGRSSCNVKAIFQMFRIANNKKFNGGLSKSLGKFGYQFKGKKHNALDDAFNTMRMYNVLSDYFKFEG